MKQSCGLILMLFLFLSLCFSQSHSYYLPGGFLYALNSRNQVVCATNDGKIVVALTDDPQNVQYGLLISFDPLSGNPIDSIQTGFGPKHVQVAATASGTRVAVLTSEGGPSAIAVYDLSTSGKLTLITKTRLTDSGGDYRSNLVLSGKESVGYAIVVPSGIVTGFELVAFSLDNASVLCRLSVGYTTPSLAIIEQDGQTTILCFRGNQELVKIDASNPTHLQEIGSLTLPFLNSNVPNYTTAGIEFGGDGRFAFIATSINGLSIIDLDQMTIKASLPGLYLDHVQLHSDGARTLLLAAKFPDEDWDNSGVLFLFDVADLTKPEVINSIAGLNHRAKFKFSSQGHRMILATDNGFAFFEIPSFNLIGTLVIPDSQNNHLQDLFPVADLTKYLGSWGIANAQFGTLSEATIERCLIFNTWKNRRITRNRTRSLP